RRPASAGHPYHHGALLDAALQRLPKKDPRRSASVRWPVGSGSRTPRRLTTSPTRRGYPRPWRRGPWTHTLSHTLSWAAHAKDSGSSRDRAIDHLPATVYWMPYCDAVRLSGALAIGERRVDLQPAIHGREPLRDTADGQDGGLRGLDHHSLLPTDSCHTRQH